MEQDKVVVQTTPDDDEDHEPEDLAGKLADKIPGKDGAINVPKPSRSISYPESEAFFSWSCCAFHTTKQEDSKGASMEDVEDDDDDDAWNARQGLKTIGVC